MRELRADARDILQAALDAVDPTECVLRALAELPAEITAAQRVVVIGAGKAAAAMAQAAEQFFGDRVQVGSINTKHGHGAPLGRVECRECGHPVPDQAGVEGSRKIAELARAAGAQDLVLCLISGGASALLPLPATPVKLEEMQEVTRALLASGASIHEINRVRKHLSAISGGRLAQMAAPARVVALILSDVIGDDLDVIGSGPTAPDASTFADARRVLRGRGIWERAPATVRGHLEREEGESPKPGDPLFARVRNVIVGSNRQALEAAKRKALELGYETVLLSSVVEGETREIAKMHAAIVKEICATGNPAERPACVLSGGETTVTVRGEGKGGRNQEFALAAALEISGMRHVLVLSAGTDGTDGPTDAAGAFAEGSTVERSREAGLDAEKHLERNDAYPLFERLGDLLITGPTRTNVMDVRIMLAM